MVYLLFITLVENCHSVIIRLSFCGHSVVIRWSFDSHSMVIQLFQVSRFGFGNITL